MAQQEKPILESEKVKLVEHLIDSVNNGISGRDADDLVDISPFRTVFAGVLQPPKQSEIQSIQEGNVTEAPSGTALGIDFRIKPASNAQQIRLRIHPRFSVYYPVFPNWEQTNLANTATAVTTNQALSNPAAIESPAGDAISESSPEVDAEGEESDHDPEPPASDKKGRVILPRVFRRIDVTPDRFEVTVPLNTARKSMEGAGALEGAVHAARETILNDPRLWRHLGEPNKRERELGLASKVLVNQGAFDRAIQAVEGGKVDLPPWATALHVSQSEDPSVRGILRIRVLLANTTPEQDYKAGDPDLEERSLYDAGLTIDIEGGSIVPFDFLLAPKDYRSTPEMAAKGINCIAKWEPGEPLRLRSETLPVFKQPLYRAKEELQISFSSLDIEDPQPSLAQIASQMEAFLRKWDLYLETSAKEELSDEEQDACKRDRQHFLTELQNYRLGVEALQRDSTLRDAFRLMNRAFGSLGAKTGGRIRSWRLFQLCFIVSQLPALAIRELSPSTDDDYAKALKGQHRSVAILWFPTGGGKTEAYLGLLSIGLLYDRLRGKERGVSTWMRFPLRMLSLQQLERLNRVIAVLNELRSNVVSLQKGDPFSVGYFVGDGVTPNSISTEDMRRYERDEKSRIRFRLIRKCPYCSSAVGIEVRRDTWRMVHVCSNEQCFSNTSSSMGNHKGSLPLVIVDNEIYRLLPSVMVGTVDKLAIIARSRPFTHILRGVTQECPTHGYASYDECVEKWSGCKPGKRGFRKLKEVKDPGPSLLIQDELHLLKADLGVFNGHYEGLLRYLGDRVFLAPKVLAATATIEAYDLQAFHVYLSTALRFPQTGWELGESFYATSKPIQFRRHYVGILSHTRGIEDPALRVLGLYLREVRRLIAAPDKARAILGRPDVSDGAILHLMRLYDFSLAYVNRKATGGSLIDKLGRIERRLVREGLGTIEGRPLTGDQPMEDVGLVLDRIEKERDQIEGSRLNVVAATNLISHGVDLERINMMTVCGMPSHYAEYVQSTSRAARSHPGIIFVCFKAKDPREASQFEFFPSMHEHMDRLIEAVAVNRFASFAPHKTVPGLLCSILLHDYSPSLFGTKLKKPLDHIPTLQTALGLKSVAAASAEVNCVSQEELATAIKQVIGVDSVRSPGTPAQIENLRKRIDLVLDDVFAQIGRTLESQLKNVVNPLISFRDVDEGLDFHSADSATLIPRLRRR